jgi:hypothetical protein
MSRKIQPLFSYYSDKVNIYQHPDFISLSAIKQYPTPLPAPIINLTTNYGQPYPVPTHRPPFPSCNGCNVNSASSPCRDCCRK